MKTLLLTRIRFRILGIVLLALIPAVVLIWYSAADRKRRMSEEIEGNTLGLSRFLASNLERDLSEGESYLEGIAELLRGKRLLQGGCSETIRPLINDASVYANLGLSGADGKVLCSARPASSIVGLGAFEWFHKLDSTNGFSVGFDFNGELSSEPSIILVQPASAETASGVSGRRYVFAVMQLGWQTNWRKARVSRRARPYRSPTRMGMQWPGIPIPTNGWVSPGWLRTPCKTWMRPKAPA